MRMRSQVGPRGPGSLVGAEVPTSLAAGLPPLCGWGFQAPASMASLWLPSASRSEDRLVCRCSGNLSGVRRLGAGQCRGGCLQGWDWTPTGGGGPARGSSAASPASHASLLHRWPSSRATSSWPSTSRTTRRLMLVSGGRAVGRLGSRTHLPAAPQPPQLGAATLPVVWFPLGWAQEDPAAGGCFPAGSLLT